MPITHGHPRTVSGRRPKAFPQPGDGADVDSADVPLRRAEPAMYDQKRGGGRQA
ncbi:hypothetical protein ACIA5C_03715 [Actinoplanes sp. NPDC051343]|uniref:hypothetical protein n=1 Tax=Actinoplanes sp. NPDC051343 TaxID=3363906 RepID=UPI0037918899